MNVNRPLSCRYNTWPTADMPVARALLRRNYRWLRRLGVPVSTARLVLESTRRAWVEQR